MNRIDELKTRMDELNRQILGLKAKRDHTANIYNEKIHELDEQIDELRKQRNMEIKPYEQQIKALNNEHNKLHNELDELVMKEAWKKFQETGEITQEAIRMLGFRPDTEIDIETKGHKLQNGIHIVRIEQNDTGEIYIRHIAFYKGKLIGMWVRRKAEHQGDETYPYAFIELENDMIPQRYNEYLNNGHLKRVKAFDELLTDEQGNLFRMSEKDDETHRYHRIKYNEWRKALKNLTQEQLENAVGIDIMDKTNRKYLIETDWMWW